jgi:beta-glucuronidase
MPRIWSLLVLPVALAVAACGSVASGPGDSDAAAYDDTLEADHSGDVVPGDADILDDGYLFDGWPDGIEPIVASDDPVLAGGLPAETAFDFSDRPSLDLSGTWRFRFDDQEAGVEDGWFRKDADRKDWFQIPVPSTWDLAVPDGFDRQTVGWYAREFAWDDASPFVRLRFEGVFREARVWLNGVELGTDDLPYLPFAFSVGDILNQGGTNVLVVRIDNRLGPNTLPCDTSTNPGRHGWFPYGGILRPVVVEGSRAMSVSHASIRALPDGDDGRVDVRIMFQRAPDYSYEPVLAARILRDGEPVLEWDAVSPCELDGLRLRGTIRPFDRWEREHPDRVYRLEIRIDDGSGTETVGLDFGFRTFEAVGGRFLLNGRDIYLHGINRHEDHPVHGPVFHPEVMARDLEVMRELGIDFSRPGHYPNDVRTLRAMEAAGILLAQEIPVYQLNGTQLADPVLLERSERALKRMILRDSHRPGIVMWSIANEVWSFTEQAVPFFKSLYGISKHLDPDRPVMAAVFVAPFLSFSELDVAPGEVDVIGINEYYGWYEGQTPDIGPYLDMAVERFPDKTLFGSEYGAGCVRGRRIYHAPGEESVNDHSYSEEYHAWFHRQHLRQYAQRDFIRGAMPWVLADFRMQWNPSTGKPHPVDRTNLKGLVDAWRIPKQSFDVVRASFSDPGGLAVPPEPECGNGTIEGSEACDLDAVSCADLATTWTGGEATCRADCTGYDVSACVRSGEADSWEWVKPAERDPARWGDARCNDGTPFAFRVRVSPTGSRNWVVALRGGGFCDDYAVPCLRSMDLMSTVPQADGEHQVPDKENGGIMDVSAAENPRFHDANLVYAPYCSSDFWAGTRTARIPTLQDPDPGWYFSGRLNAQAMMETLVRRYGLADDGGDGGVRLLYSGTSAGATGALNTVDLAAAMLPSVAAAGDLHLLVDAGWLVHDWDEPDARLMMAETGDADVVRRAHLHLQMRMNPLCESSRVWARHHAGDCIFGLHAFQYLVAPRPGGLGIKVMVQQSLRDDTLAGYHNHPDDKAFAIRYGQRILADILAADPDDGMKGTWFLGDTPYHDVSRRTSRWTNGSPGHTFKDVLERFWDGAPPERVIWTPESE